MARVVKENMESRENVRAFYGDLYKEVAPWIPTLDRFNNSKLSR